MNCIPYYSKEVDVVMIGHAATPYEGGGGIAVPSCLKAIQCSHTPVHIIQTGVAMPEA